MVIRLADTHKFPVPIEKLQAEYHVIAPLLKKELGHIRVKI
jgi:hypothetical protein